MPRVFLKPDGKTHVIRFHPRGKEFIIERELAVLLADTFHQDGIIPQDPPKDMPRRSVVDTDVLMGY
jgi:hypothetical protein